MKNIIITLASIVVLTLVACKNESAPVAMETESSVQVDESDGRISITKQQFQSSGYELGKSVKHTFDQIIKASGEIHLPVNQMAQVSTFMEGTVGEINAHVGEWVSKGSVLFTLTNPALIDIQEQFLLNQNTLNYKLSESKRLSELVNEKLAPMVDLTKIESEINILNTQIGAGAKKLKLYGVDPAILSNENLRSSINIAAPQSGHILEIKVMEGMYVHPGESLISIANTSRNKLELNVLEKDINAIAIGQELYFYTAGKSDLKYKARVYLIDPMVSADRTVTVHCNILSKHGGKLKSGSFVNAEIINESIEGNALSIESIVAIGDKSYALRLSDETDDIYSFEKIVLERKGSDTDFVILDNAISKDEVFLLKGAYYLITE